MADINAKFKLVNGVLRPSYYDKHTRDLGIFFYKQVENLIFRHGTKEGIDLILESNPKVGAEGEGDSWDGNYWDSYKSDLFGFSFRTTNIPHRKFHYYNLQELSDKYQYFRGVFNEGWLENWYFRVNHQEDQIISIPASTIHNRDMTHFKKDGKTHMSNVPEDWLCVEQQFSPTFNKQPNNIWLLNGPYHGPSVEEAIKIEIERERIIKEKSEELAKKRIKELNIFGK